MCCAYKPETIEYLQANIRDVTATIRLYAHEKM